MKKLVIILLIGFTFVLEACKKDGEKPCEDTKSASALIVDFPDSVKVGTVQNVNVQYVLENSCGAFDHFEVSFANNVYEVKLITKYQGCNCVIELIDRSVDYEINIDFPGVYEIKFWLADEEYDSRTIIVYE